MVLTKTQIATLADIRHKMDTQIELFIAPADLFAITLLPKNQIIRGFERLYGVSFFHYHLKRKLAHGESLLLAGHSIKEVAHLLNYSTPGSFSRSFKHWMGYTPGSLQRE